MATANRRANLATAWTSGVGPVDLVGLDLMVIAPASAAVHAMAMDQVALEDLVVPVDPVDLAVSVVLVAPVVLVATSCRDSPSSPHWTPTKMDVSRVTKSATPRQP